MVRSAANRQGNVREFHSVWRVVTLRTASDYLLFTILSVAEIPACVSAQVELTLKA